jgi:hypothetical protein
MLAFRRGTRVAMLEIMHKDNVVISTPCGADWNAMDPRGRKRLCGSCDKLVHDLSALEEKEAGELLAGASSLCVRYLYDENGRIWFRQDLAAVTPAIIPDHRLKRGAKGALALSAMLAAPVLFQACGGNNGYNGYYRDPQSNEADGGVPEDQTATEQVPGDAPNTAATDVAAPAASDGR